MPFTLLLALAIAVASPRGVEAQSVPLLPGLGRHHYPVTTRSPRVQEYFDQGLRLTWAFNHDEAVRAFEEGERLDPNCAMCAWGVAFALGPNINTAMDSAAGVRAWQALQRARRGWSRISERERALVDALSQRYASVPLVSRAPLDSAWARAMAQVVERFPDDREAQVLLADALMNLTPWIYWTPEGRERPGTGRILSLLRDVLEADPDHPGACHLYVHAVEEARPADAIPCAERLAKAMPAAGHVVHLPAHLYARVGRWADAIAVNEHALHADGAMLERDGAARRGLYAGAYIPHNSHFLAFAATMAGRSRVAIAAAREAARRIPAQTARTVPWVEAVTPIVPLTLVTFGRWTEILDEPLPHARMPRFEAGMRWYARGVAHAALGDPEGARTALDRLSDVAREYPPGDNAIALRIAVRALQGEIALRGGRVREAIPFFREALRMEDALTYNEPPTWYYPMRHSLGAALLAAGAFQEAERTYRDDLARYPGNGWSLKGLATALEQQGRHADAEAALREFRVAWRAADVILVGSRY